MSRDCTLTKKVSQVISLNYHNTLAKINIAILFAIIFAKSITIYIVIQQKVSRYFIAAILYHDINNFVRMLYLVKQCRATNPNFKKSELISQKIRILHKKLKFIVNRT